MSVDLQNGYKLRNKPTIDELHRFSMQVRGKMQEVSIHILERLLAQTIVDWVDTVVAKGRDVAEKEFSRDTEFSFSDSLLRQAYWNIQRRHENIKKTQQRDSEFDFHCKLVFLPIPQKMLVLLFSEQNDYLDAWESFAEVEEYAYYNHTDRPKKLTKGQWDRRRKNWLDLALKNRIPSMNGFVVECVAHVPWIGDVDDTRILSNMPSLGDRALHKARRIVLDRKCHELQEQSVDCDGFELVFEAMDWLKTDDGEVAVETEREQLLLKLKPSFCESDLRKSIQELITTDTQIS